MKVADLFEQMTQTDAVRVFQHLGVDPTEENLRQSYLTLLKQHHPDRGGNVELAKLINVAYSTLDQEGLPQATQSKPKTQPQTGEEWTLWVSDGRSLVDSVTLRGSASQFDAMAKTMIDREKKAGKGLLCRAIMASNRKAEMARRGNEGEVFLIFANGQFLGTRPVRMRHNSASANPLADRTFAQWLPAKLAEIR